MADPPDVALSEEQYKTCVSAFEAFCREGYLAPFELNNCLRSLGHSLSGDEFNALLDEHDVYSRGGLNLQSFLYIIAAREASVEHKKRLTAAFALFDRDSNGFVSSEELKEAFTSLGENPYTDAEWDAFMQEYELTPDGQIEYGLLVELMAKKLEPVVG